MNRAPALGRLSRALLRQHQQVRHGGGAPVHVGARWSNIVRGESNIITPDNPPTQPLSDNHEVGDGTSDFSKYYEEHSDVSPMQAATGLSAGLLFFYIAFQVSKWDHDRNKSVFTIREAPTLEADIPTMDHSVARGPRWEEKRHNPTASESE